jgi:predicted acylesterase/phospholipase RssA
MSDDLHVVVHSGGGANGAFGLGVMEHLFKNLGVAPASWVGTSVGGLNGGLVCQFPVGEELAALDHALSVWTTVTPNLMYKHWPPGGTIGDMRGVVCKTAVYNAQPLHEFIAKHLDVGQLRISGRPLFVSLVDLGTGELLYVDQGHDEIIAAVQGTSAYPFFFPPVTFEGRRVSDGGLREITPLQKAVELGATFIDVICCQQANVGTFDPFGKVTLELGPRYLELMSAEINKNDLLFDPHEGREVTVRLWQPQASLGSGLDFGQEKVQKNRTYGREYAESRGSEGTRTWTIGGCAEVA